MRRKQRGWWLRDCQLAVVQSPRKRIEHQKSGFFSYVKMNESTNDFTNPYVAPSFAGTFRSEMYLRPVLTYRRLSNFHRKLSTFIRLLKMIQKSTKYRLRESKWMPWWMNKCGLRKEREFHLLQGTCFRLLVVINGENIDGTNLEWPTSSTVYFPAFPEDLSIF